MSAILPLIEDAIDVRLMDVKNISNLIYSYVEYDEYEGPQYDIFMELYEPDYHFDGDRNIDKVFWYVFIFENKPLVVSKIKERRLAIDGGITINGIHYNKNWNNYAVLEEWFYDRIMSIRGYKHRGRSLEDYFMYGLRWRHKIATSLEFKKYHREDDWVKKIKEAKRKPTKKQFEKLMFEKVLEPFVNFYIEKIKNL